MFAIYFLTISFVYADSQVFNITPLSGHWIDYAKSGRISDAGYIIFMVKGAPLDYSSGQGQVRIYNNNGAYQYSIPNAINAVYISGNFMGDSNSYIYMNRGDETRVHLFNKNLGSRNIELRPNTPENNPTDLDKEVSSMWLDVSMHKELGLKYNYVGQYDPISKTISSPIISFDYYYFNHASVNDLFLADIINIEYNQITFQNIFDVHSGVGGFTLTDQVEPTYGIMFVSRNLSISDVYIPPQVKTLWLTESYRIISSAFNDGYIHIMARADNGVGEFKQFVFKPNGDLLIAIDDNASEPLKNWVSLINQGRFYIQGTVISTMQRNEKISLDTSSFILTKQSLNAISSNYRYTEYESISRYIIKNPSSFSVYQIDPNMSLADPIYSENVGSYSGTNSSLRIVQGQ